MKKIVLGLIIFGFADTVLAVSHRIDLYRNPGSLEVWYDSVKKKLKPGHGIKFGDFAIGLWNGEYFSLTSNGEILENLNISSREIPIVFDSFCSSGKCKVCAAGVKILDDVQLTDFLVELDHEDKNVLDIAGYLKTRFCNVFGSTVVNGVLEVADGGIISLKSLQENALMIYGTLLSKGGFSIDLSRSYTGKIINNGTIYAPSEVIFETPDFSNGELGQIRSNRAQFKIRKDLQNSGLLAVNQLSVSSVAKRSKFSDSERSHIRFIQGDKCYANQADLSCNIESSGETKIGQLTFSKGLGVTFDVTGGETEVNSLTGSLSSFEASNGSTAKIGRMCGGTSFIGSSNGDIHINDFTSDNHTIFTTNSYGNITVNNAAAPEEFVYSQGSGNLNFSRICGNSLFSLDGSANTHVNRADQLTIMTEGKSETVIENSRIKYAHLLGHSKNTISKTKSKSVRNQGDLHQSDAKTDVIRNDGKLYQTHTNADIIYNSGKLYQSNATTDTIYNESKLYQSESVTSSIYNRGKARQSKVRTNSIYNEGKFYQSDARTDTICNKGEFHQIDTETDVVHNKGRLHQSESSTKTIYNEGKVYQTNTKTDVIRNDGTVTFRGTTFTKELSNRNKVTFKSGDHDVETYDGKIRQSTLKVRGKGETTKIKSTANVNLKDGDAKVTINQAIGTGTIEATQQKYNKLSIPFFLKGNVDVTTKHMPRPEEIPEHDRGHFRLYIDMDEDFINDENRNYGDVLFMLNMQGHKWRNQNALFQAGGLHIDNAAEFENHDGKIKLEKRLNVHAWRITNDATAIAKENGRWVEDCSNWRAHLVYYCPATYYSADLGTGIAVIDGDIVLKSDGDIVNRFSTMQAAGTFDASAGQNFDNIVSYITALGDGSSSIAAKKINNKCLDAYLRRGEAHASGSCGWGFGRHTWHADSYTAEWITQSPGAEISVSGDLKLKGKTNNFGSNILSGGLFEGNVNSKSLFENTATVGSMGTAINGNNVKCSSPFFFVNKNVIKTME